VEYHMLFSYQRGYIMCMRHPIHEIWRDTYFDVIEEWRQRYGNGHLEIRKMKIKEANLFNTVGSYRVSHEGKYCTKFLNQYSFICNKFYKLYKYNINISHNKTTGLRKFKKTNG
jgi:hypothetical protein